MNSSQAITWRPTDVRDLLEARIVDDDGSALYAGYIVRRAGEGDDEWHGYIGIAHVLVGVGRREAVQAAVERAAREAWAAQLARLTHADSVLVDEQHREESER